MAAKAVDTRKRFDRNHRFRGHGPLLQFVVHPPSVIEATCKRAMPAKAVDAGNRFNQNDRFRGHGPLLQGNHSPRAYACRRALTALTTPATSNPAPTAVSTGGTVPRCTCA